MTTYKVAAELTVRMFSELFIEAKNPAQAESEARTELMRASVPDGYVYAVEIDTMNVTKEKK